MKERMVTSTVHELNYVVVVGEGNKQYFKCSLCAKIYPSALSVRKEVKTHLIQDHYSAIGVVFANEDDAEEGGGAYRTNGRWEGHGESDSEDMQEGKEETEGDGDRSGVGNGGSDTAASAPTAMSWPKTRKEDADRALARWFYSNLIPFNVIRNPYFKEMIEAISNAGRTFVAPSLSNLESPLTDEEKAAIDKRKKAINQKRKRRRM